MGNGYYNAIVHFSKGEYSGANNFENDLGIVTNSQNDVGYRTDDHGNATSSATLIDEATGTIDPTKYNGIIEQPTDKDYFEFTTAGGNVNISFQSGMTGVHYSAPNLDIQARLLDENGTEVTKSDPSGLNASISTSVQAGTYYIEIDGVGAGSPSTNGYSDYGSLGYYEMSGSFPPGNNNNPPEILSVTSTPDCNTVTFEANVKNTVDNVLWEFGDGGTSTNATAIHTYTQSGQYTVKLTVTNQNGSDTSTETITVTVLAPPTVADDCGSGSLVLTASGGSGTFNWYDAATGGSLLHTGNTYSPTITGPTTYYVEESSAGAVVSGGPLNPAAVGTGGYFPDNDIRGIFFDATKDVVIKSVYVDANGAGTRTFELLDGDGGNVLQTKDVNLTNGTQRVTLDFPVAAGTGYYMKITGTLVDLYRNTAGASYPYDIGGLISLTGNNYTDQGYYYFFYDWEVQEPGCTGPRTKVDVDTCNTVGVTNLVREGEFLIYPNPANNVLYFENKNQSAKHVTLKVYSTGTGQLIKTFSIDNAKGSIDLSQLSKGVYSLQIDFDNQYISTQKLVVLH
ncbi:MAG: T9SS type A sorting domain-containing protein [Flavobacteriales bacterium]|nr:T9SS type A sorting domain-containing protein [Flavobacteriales bacterium]